MAFPNIHLENQSGKPTKKNKIREADTAEYIDIRVLRGYEQRLPSKNQEI